MSYEQNSDWMRSRPVEENILKCSFALRAQRHQYQSSGWRFYPSLTVRRITIAAIRVVEDEGVYQMDLFTDTSTLEKEKQLQQAMLGIKQKYGKNAVLKGTSYMDGATMRGATSRLADIKLSETPCIRCKAAGREDNLQQTDFSLHLLLRPG